jgi:hypothetical protein
MLLGYMKTVADRPVGSFRIDTDDVRSILALNARALAAEAEAAGLRARLAEEREACAAIAEAQALQWINGPATTSIGQAYQRGCREAAALIRSRAPAEGGTVDG